MGYRTGVIVVWLLSVTLAPLASAPAFASVDTLRAAVEAFDALGPDLSLVATDMLIGAMRDLEAGRDGLNAVDHAVAERAALRGLDPNLRQLRAIDALQRRGVPLARIPHARPLDQWLRIASQEAWNEYGPMGIASLPGARVDDNGVALPGIGAAGPLWPDASTATGGHGIGYYQWSPRVRRMLDAVAAGHWERGVYDILRQLGLPTEGLWDTRPYSTSAAGPSRLSR